MFRWPDQENNEWEVNAGVQRTLDMLKPIQTANPGISWADLIVLAATMALDKAGATGLKDMFCPGRVDDPGPKGWDEFLKPRIVGAVEEDILKFRVSTITNTKHNYRPYAYWKNLWSKFEQP